jgi:NADH:ubiquinone oxidoreductase subunit E
MPKAESRPELQVCLNRRPSDCCDSQGALQLYRELKKNFGEQVNVRATTCLGLCKQGPALKLILHGEEHLMIEGTLESVREMLEQHGI